MMPNDGDDIPVLRGLIALRSPEAEVRRLRPPETEVPEAEVLGGSGSAGDDQDSGPEAEVPGLVPMTVRERLAVVARHWRDGAVDMWLARDRLLHTLWHGQPESMADYAAHIRSRAWVPPEMEGRPARIWAWAGVICYLLFSVPVNVTAKAVGVAAERLIRFVPAIVLAYIGAQILRNLTG